MGKRSVIAAGFIALALTLSGCALPVVPQPSAEPVGGCEDSKWGCDEPIAETPEPEAPELGSLESPFPRGYVATITSSGESLYSVSAKLVSGDADKAIKKKNQFNDPAPKGMKYILVDYTFTGLSDSETTDPSYESYANLSIATPDGHVYPQITVVVPGKNPMSSAPELYNGQSYTGREAYLVPATSTSWFVTILGSYITL